MKTNTCKKTFYFQLNHLLLLSTKQLNNMAISERARALEILESLRNDWNLSDAEMLDYVIKNWMSGEQAEAVMLDICEEYDVIPFEEIDEEEEES